ncbi:hypothetical protein A9995_06965 [Erythrobacter sp. QSSC1-22B]|nr:hypothetical protein A9995_06965 [Erythrobacter sp. QSSC1-22B]
MHRTRIDRAGESLWHLIVEAIALLVVLLDMRSVTFGRRAALMAAVRYEMHSAFRAIARLVPPDFSMHRTNIAAHDGRPRPKKR